MSTERGKRHTCSDRGGSPGEVGEVVLVGDPMFWKALTSARSVGDSTLLLSLFNLKTKHLLKILVNKIEQNSDFGSDLQTLTKAARTTTCGARMTIHMMPLIT